MADTSNPQSGQKIDLRTSSSAATTQQGSGAASSSGAGKGLFEKFEIPETVRQKYPDLIPLILETESMSDEERQYWFQILPIMTDEQVNKLREILINEKKQLEQIDKEYNQEMKKINAEHVTQWKAFEAKEKRKKLASAEESAETKEKEDEEDLLKKLQGF